MAEADAKNWLLAEQLTNRVDRIVERLGIAGTVGKKNAVGLLGENFFGGRSAGQHRDLASLIVKMPRNIPLHPKIQRHDMRTLPFRFALSACPIEMRPLADRLAPVAGHLGEDFADEVATNESGARLGFGDEAGVVEVLGRDDASQGASGTDTPHQCPGVDRFDRDDAPFFEELAERSLRSKIAGHPAMFADNEAGQMGAAAFEVVFVDAVVADLRVRHGHDLATVAGIGEDLLVAGHRGVETDFAVDFALDPNRNARVDRAIFEGELCSWLHERGGGVRGGGVGKRGL